MPECRFILDGSLELELQMDNLRNQVITLVSDSSLIFQILQLNGGNVLNRRQR
jgi:hypothetical protein